MAGPVPHREEELAAPRKADRGEVTKGVAREVKIPRMDPDWHPIAKMFWKSLKKSGQSDFYQQSDWAFAYSLCEDLSMYKKPLLSKEGVEYHKRSGQMLQTIYSAMERLMVTEGDRRRMRLELQKPEPEEAPASVTLLNDYKEGLGLD